MNNMRKLMEAVQLNEYERTEPIYIEYRDPDGEFVVKYRASRGYYVEGDGADSAPSFENLDDAIEHGELSIMSYSDTLEEGGAEYGPEAAMFEAGFRAGFQADAFTEEDIKRAFKEFAGENADYEANYSK